MKPIPVITFVEQDVLSRIAQALSYGRLEGLKNSTQGEKLIKEVASGTVSVEQALLELKRLHQVTTHPSRQSKKVREVEHVC